MKKRSKLVVLVVALVLVATMLTGCDWAGFCSYSDQGLLSSRGAQASHCSGFSCCGA